MSANDNSFSQSGQRLALRWMTRYLRHPAKISHIREETVAQGDDASRRARRLHSAAIRHLRLYREILRTFVARSPDPQVEAALVLALAEIDLNTQGKGPAIIDSWVGLVRQTNGQRATGFANAVLRKSAIRLSEVREGRVPLPLAVMHSHPDWLVQHWVEQFGLRETRRLLEWNQRIPKLYASGAGGSGCSEGLAGSRWPGFFELSVGISPEVQHHLDTGQLTIRDPATRIAGDFLCAQHPQSALDLCASPGGKSRSLLTRPDGPQRLVAVDLEERLPTLIENLKPWEEKVTVRACDLRRAEQAPKDWLQHFDAVLLDAPCSNTGVIQRKPDIKWRLAPEDLSHMPSVQLELLCAAVRFVRSGGVLVYSTCSIEDAENRGVIEAFLRSPEGQSFRLSGAVRTLPTRTGHDGAGVFRLHSII